MVNPRTFKTHNAGEHTHELVGIRIDGAKDMFYTNTEERDDPRRRRKVFPFAEAKTFGMNAQHG